MPIEVTFTGTKHLLPSSYATRIIDILVEYEELLNSKELSVDKVEIKFHRIHRTNKRPEPTLNKLHIVIDTCCEKFNIQVEGLFLLDTSEINRIRWVIIYFLSGIFNLPDRDIAKLLKKRVVSSAMSFRWVATMMRKKPHERGGIEIKTLSIIKEIGDSLELSYGWKVVWPSQYLKNEIQNQK